MKDQTRAALGNQTTWMRLPVMLLFFLLLQVATPLLIVVSLVAWFMRLFNGQQPQGVVEFGQTIGEWFDRTSDYLCGGAERRPFPFEDHDCPSDRAAESSASARTSNRAADQGRDADAATRMPEAPAAGAVQPGSASNNKAVRKKATGKTSSKKKSSPRKKAAKTPGKKAGGRKTGGKKAGGRKTGGKKAGGRKTGGKKTGGKKTGGKKTGGKKTGGNKAAAKQASAKDSGEASGVPSATSSKTTPKDGDQTPSDAADRA